jgi:hypothetical protein
MLPDDEVLLNEFQSNGFVSIRVSAKSYEDAKELQTVIERKHWEVRALQPLSIPMSLVALGFGLMPCIGIMFFFMVNDVHRSKGYHRKAKSFSRWFVVGLALSGGVIAVCMGLSH